MFGRLLYDTEIIVNGHQIVVVEELKYTLGQSNGLGVGVTLWIGRLLNGFLDESYLILSKIGTSCFFT